MTSFLKLIDFLDTPDGVSYHTRPSPRLAPTAMQTVHAVAAALTTGSDAQNPVVRPATPIHAQPAGLQPLQVFWNGKDLDDLLENVQNADRLSRHGDYMLAKPIFMECLDGIEALLTPIHAVFTHNLCIFVSWATKYNDFDEATTRAHKAFDGHVERLGQDDKRTWQCLARLGQIYLQRESTSQAFHMLHNAREGLLAATTEPEDAYLNTLDITRSLIKIADKQGDLEAIEREYTGLISHAEKLGGMYRADLMKHKHDLIHHYLTMQRMRDDVGLGCPNRNRMEQLLLDLKSFKWPGPGMHHIDICCRAELCNLYNNTGHDEKLQQALEEAEAFLDRTAHVGVYQSKMLSFRKAVAASYHRLGRFEKAEAHLRDLLHQTENTHLEDMDRISILSLLSATCIKSSGFDAAEPHLKKAQQIALRSLAPEHPFHSRVRGFLEARSMTTEHSCPTCLVNDPGEVINDWTEASRRAISGHAVLSYPHHDGISHLEHASDDDMGQRSGFASRQSSSDDPNDRDRLPMDGSAASGTNETSVDEFIDVSAE
jgi:tetratricopeptide (TPR) repeat protein